MQPINYATDDANTIANHWKTASRFVISKTMQRYSDNAAISQKLELANKLTKLYKLTDEVNSLITHYERMNNA